MSSPSRDRSLHSNDAISIRRAVDFAGSSAYLRWVSDGISGMIKNNARVETFYCLGSYGKRQEGKDILEYFL